MASRVCDFASCISSRSLFIDHPRSLRFILSLRSLRLTLRGLSSQPLGLEPLAIVGKCLLRDLVLSHCLLGINLAKCLARIALRFGDRLAWFKLARCLCHFFAFSPSPLA